MPVLLTKALASGAAVGFVNPGALLGSDSGGLAAAIQPTKMAGGEGTESPREKQEKERQLMQGKNNRRSGLGGCSCTVSGGAKNRRSTG